MDNYRPLPDNLTIKESNIQGLGIFATKDIPAHTNLGPCHIQFGADVFRYPLGGFYNHSNTPNCVKRPEQKTPGVIHYHLFTLREIKAGEEITVEYTFYEVS